MTELFANFEINRAPRWPRLLRAFAGAVALHSLLAALVVYVPTVRSVLHIAGMFSDTEYTDEDYTLAGIRERATMLKFPPREKLYYPPGYFSTNSPLAPVAPDAQIIEEARNVRPTPTPRPRATPKPTPSPAPSPTPDASATPEVAANKTESDQKATGEATASPTPADGSANGFDKKTEEEMNKLAEKTKVKRFPPVNVKPFKDLLAKSKTMLDKGELDLKGTITMTIEADRNDDGTLSNITVTKVSTENPKLKAIAVEFVQALGASRALAPLEGTRHITMAVESNPLRIGAVVTTLMDTPERASDMALGYGGMIALARLTKRGRDEGEIYNSTKVSANGREVRMSFGMSREAATKIITKQIPASPAS